MQLLNQTLVITFILKPQLTPIITFRMVKATLENGICALSSVGFASYGCILVSSIISDFEGGYKFGRVAIETMNRLKALEVSLILIGHEMQCPGF